MPELKIYRQSKLKTLKDGCLYRHDQIWNKGIDDSGDLALVGVAFHAIKYRYIVRLMDHQIPSDVEEARSAFTEGIVAAKTPSRLIPEVRDLWDFHAERFSLAVDRVVAAEERQLSGDVSWAPDLVLAHPDTNELEIKDSKSGWAPPPTEDALKQNFQARIYSFYGQLRWKNFSSYRFTIDAIRWNRSTSVVFTPAELDDVEREVRALIALNEDAERTNEWPAVPGPACGFCNLVCPLEAPTLIPKRILTPAIRQQLGSYALAQEAQLKAIKKLLKADCTANGPLTINGMVWENRPVQEKKYPADVVVKMLEQISAVGGLDPVTPGSDLMFSHSSLKAYFKTFPILLDQLAPYAQEKTSYRFSAKKPGGDEGEDE